MSGQSYSVPNINSGCPSNCRQIPWLAGSDVWNGGTLPVYGQVTCTPLNENGSTDDTTNVQNCINAATVGTGSYSTCHAAGGCAVFLPAGSIFINGTLRVKSNVVVRGAKPEGVVFGTTYLPTTDATATTLILGTGAQLTNDNFTYSNISGYNGFATFPSPSSLSGTPQKGDTTVTIGSGSVSVGTWMKIFGNDDPGLIFAEGSILSWCDWCGDNSGFYTQQQIVQVTGFVSGTGGVGSVVNLSRPLYYTPYTTSITVHGHSESAGAKYNTIPFVTQKAGWENLRISGASNDIGGTQVILFQACLFCWEQNVESYVTGTSSGSAHVEFDFSYGGEVRNNYMHDERSGASGAGYDVYFQFVNGDHKVENNVMRHGRHAVVYQGGGSGTAILYNYMDDMYTDDTTYMASARTSHGAHPFMNLWEGNVASHVAADSLWGTSSHFLFFRNWLWGDETENFSFPGGCSGCAATGTPNNGFDAVDLYGGQEYYAFVGNVLGLSAIPTGANNSCQITSTSARHANFTNATLTGYNQSPAPATPLVYSMGTTLLADGVTGSTTASSSGTAIRNGNYDYKTIGVAFWDGGSTNNSIGNSYYYSSKPAWFGTCPWPGEGFDVSGINNLNPAQATFLGANIASPATAPAPAPGLFAMKR